MVVGERDVARVTLHYVQPAFARQLHSGVGELQCRGPPSRGLEDPGVAACAGADVESIRRGHARDRLGDDVPPLPEPPMVVLEVGHVLDLCALHREEG